MPALPIALLFWLLSLGLVAVAALHAATSQAVLDRFAAGVLVPIGLVGLVIWTGALWSLRRRSRS
jgi:hypothetical protein